MFFRNRSQLKKPFSTSRSRRRHELRVALVRQSLKPRFETLEIRALLATVTWDGGGAGTFDWQDALNWDTNSVPLATDDAVIPDLTGTPTINVNTGFTAQVRSVTSAERVSIGSLSSIQVVGVANSTFAGGLDIIATNSVQLGTATVAGGTWTGFGVSGSVTNTGTLNLDLSLGAASSGPSLTNATGGTVAITGNRNLSINLTNQVGGVVIVNQTSTISGTVINAGNLQRSVVGTGTVSASYTSSGTTDVQVGNLAFTGGGTHTGSATVSAGAVLSLSGGTTIIQTGAAFGGAGVTEFKAGAVNVTGNASFTNLQLNSNPLTVTVSAGAELTTTGSSLWQSGATVTGAGTWTNTGTLDASTVGLATANLGGTVTLVNQGTLNISPAGAFITAVGTSITNAAGAALTIRSVNLNGNLTNSGTAITSAGMSIGSTATITNTPSGTYNLTGTGSINGGGTSSFTNAGLVRRTTSGGTYGISTAFSNTGIVDVESGTLSLTGIVAQLSGPTFIRTLTAGTWSAQSGSILSFPTGNNIQTIADGASISLVGASSSVQPFFFNGLAVDGSLSVTGGASLNGLGTPLQVTSTGTVTVGVGSNLNNFSSVDNAGTVIMAGSFLVAAYQQTAGLTRLDGGSLAASNFGASGGTLAGTGTIFNVSLTNATLAPGASPGILNITGNLTLNSGSITNIEIQGTNPATPDFDQILVSGTATLAGTLNVSLLNGFIPDKSDSFQIMTFASRSGDFTTKNFPSYSNYQVLASSPGATTYSLVGTAYAVRNTNDSGSNSLRKAITDANASPGADAILFNIPGAGVHTITPLSGLPTSNGQLVIDATSQSGYTGTPLIEIRGDSAGNVYGVAVSGALGSGSVIKGLVINRFQLSGVLIINGANGVTIQNNFIGTDASGTVANANGIFGVDINGSSGTIVSNNLISGNGDYGIAANTGGVAGSVDGTVITGNRIGTNAAGTAGLGNVSGGIYLGGATNTIIGGTTLGSLNVISGNTGAGIRISGAATTGNKIVGNYIGTNASGTGKVANNVGVIVENNASNNIIGTNGDGSNDAIEGNVISGNSTSGILIRNAGTDGNWVAGNLIGTDFLGTSSLGNGTHGIHITLDASNTIVGSNGDGTSDTLERNVISGNIQNGVQVDFNVGTITTTISGNTIGLGLNAGGATAIANVGHGIYLQQAALLNVFSNVISGNSQDGIQINGAGTTAFIASNLIGTNTAGTVVVGNVGSGIDIRGGATGTRIGGTGPIERNAISGNARGIQIDGANTAGNIITGNSIGTGRFTDLNLGNVNEGVRIQGGAHNNTIGGTVAGAGNVISGNAVGVVLNGIGATNNILQANYIGSNSVGTTAIPNSTGVSIESGATNNTIGGTTITSKNVISGNTSSGIRVIGAGSNNNSILGNLIGVDGRSAPTGAVGWWRAEGNAADFAGTNNGVIQGTVPSVTGKVGTAFSFDGSSANYVQVPNAASLEPVASVSVEAWIKHVGSPGATRYVLTKGGDNFSGSYAIYTGSTGGLQFYARTGTGFYLTPDAGVGIWDGVWHHVVGVYDGASVKLFVDGTQVGSANPANGNITYGLANNDLYLGHYEGTTFSTGIAADIDEATVYNRGLSADEVKAIYELDSYGKAGFAALANGVTGIEVSNGASSNTIGGASTGARNIVSGNGLNGILIADVSTTGNTVIGNYIGTDVAAAVGLNNSVVTPHRGVAITNGASGNAIGGTSGAARNVLSGNYYGVRITDGSNNSVSGNYIGTNASGISAVPNFEEGVYITGGSGNVIGGSVSGSGNVISGNNDVGVWLDADYGRAVTGNVVAGNLIGLDASGLTVLANAAAGVLVSNGAVGNTIGGTTIGARNIIAGHTTPDYGSGVFIGNTDSTTTTSGNVVQGNWIGLNAAGAAAGNGFGVQVGSYADGNLIGGTLSSEANVISGNTVAGVNISSGPNYGLLILRAGRNNRISGNFIGTNAAGTAAIANTTGVLFQSGASNNTIGGATAGARNVISGNTSDGINIQGAGTNGNAVRGNYIGVDVGGNTQLANGGAGVIIASLATGNTVGGLTGVVGNPAPGTGPGNVISGNALYQVRLFSDGQVVQGNIIGLGADGNTVIGGAGINTGDGTNNSLLGGTDVRARNVISGLTTGIFLGTGSGTQILNNYVGTDMTGTLNRAVAANYFYGPTNLTWGAAGAGNVWVTSSYGIQGFGSNWTIQANRFGTSANGNTPMLSSAFLSIYSLTNLIVGGTGVGEGNQFADSLAIQLSSSGVIAGNTFGLNAAGSAVLTGSTAELSFYRDSNFTIGGSTASARNVFASDSDGLAIQGFGSESNVVRGNYFGTNLNGTVALGNLRTGIRVDWSSSNNILDGNVIAKTGAAGGAGILISGQDSYSTPDFSAAWFKADGNFTNSTGYGQPGTAVGTVGFGTGVVAGQAFQFSRATPGYVKSEHIASYTLSAANVSVESWINLANLPTNGQEYYIASNGDSTDPNYAAFLTNSGGISRLAFRYHTSTGSQTATSASINFGIGSFHHVVVTADGTNVKFYVDGALLNTVAIVGTPSTVNIFAAGDPSVTLYVGGGIGATPRTFDGKIDELSVNNRALTPAEINRIFTIGGIDRGGNWTRNTTVTGNIIGLLADGTTPGAVTGDGIRIDNSESNTIGGTTLAARNIISKVGGSGINLTDKYARFNVIEGNYVGTDKNGTTALGNIGSGIAIVNGASNNTIGGTSTGARNIISGNTGTGVLVAGGTTSGNTIAGNYIGVDASGAQPLGNETGVVVDSALNTTVGSLIAAGGNVISGNTGSATGTSGTGLLVTSAPTTKIYGNTIGLNATGNSAVGNLSHGIAAFGSSNGLVIGGSVIGARNVVAGNLSDQISLSSDGVHVQGNYISTSKNGLNAIDVGTNYDVEVIGSNITIGTDGNNINDDKEGNLIASVASTLGAIFLFGTADRTVIAGNSIGVGLDGTSRLGTTGRSSIYLTSATTNTRIGTDDNGTSDLLERNVIAGGTTAAIIALSDGSKIAGNYIGTDSTGSTPLGSVAADGINLQGSNNMIGGLTEISRNVISGFIGGSGIILGIGTNNSITGNFIGTKASGASPLPNLVGVILNNGAFSNTIGGTTAAARNVISGNLLNGVVITGTGTNTNKVQGNWINLTSDGMTRLGNSNPNSSGVVIESGAANNLIGGDDATDGSADGLVNARNVIVPANSSASAVYLSSSGNTLAGNYLGTERTGTLPLGGYYLVYSDVGPNTIGGTTAGAGNVLAGSGTGLWLRYTTSSGSTVAGNWIGTNSAGASNLGNSTGIFVSGGSNITIGGTTAGAMNVISGNSEAGIQIDGASNNTIAGNKIGVSTLEIVLPNAIGIRVVNASPSNVFNDNDVRGSTSDNFLIEAAGNILRRNASAGMGGLPIKLNPATLTPGAISIFQIVSGTNPRILGEVSQAQPNRFYTIDLFSSPTAGEADRYLVSAAVTTDASGFATFSISPPVGQVNGYVSATLTGLGSNGTVSTSQLSNSLLATPAIILGLRSQSPEGTPITLTAFASSNPVTGYLWEVKKDGLPYAFELRTDGTQSDGGIQFTPDDEGAYTVSLRVTLSDGSQSLLGPFAINVFNVAPTPSFEYAPSIIAAGNVVTLTSNNSDPGQLDVLQSSWEVRSDSPTGTIIYPVSLSTGPITSFIPAAGGFYYVTMTVDDGDGGVRSLTRELAVNGLPSATTIVVSDTSVLEGQTVRARAPEAELNRTEQLTFHWTVSKTPVVGPTVSYLFVTPSRGVVEFVPDDNGTYTISLTISEGPNSVVATPQQVIVGNVAPRVQITTPTTSLTSGVPIKLTSAITDPGTADTHSVAWSVTRDHLAFGTFATGVNFSFTPTLPGIYIVTAKATDDDGGLGTTERGFALLQNVPIPPSLPTIPSIPVVPPIPAIPSPPTAVNPAFISNAVAIAIVPPTGPFSEGQSYVFNASVPTSVTTYAWKARNATGFQVASATTSSFAFTPSQGGSYLIELAVTLTDGRRGFAVFAPMTVQGIAPTISTMNVIDPLTGNAVTSTIYEGSKVTVRTVAVDSRESIGLNYRWEMKKPNETVFNEMSGVDGAPTDFRFLPPDEGTYDVRVSVSDSQGLITTRNLAVVVANANPFVRISGLPDPQNSNLIAFSAIASDPGSADTPSLRYQWSVNGGSFSTPLVNNQFSVSRSLFSIASTPNVIVQVTDGDGGSAQVAYYIILGGATTSASPFVIDAAVQAAAGTADQILYLGSDGSDFVKIAAGITKKVVVFGGKGNDFFDASLATGDVLLDGGEGNDTLTGGLGDDVLIAGPGTNVLVGGNGKNRFVGGGSDTMTGGVNSDYYEVHFSTVVLSDTTGGIDTIDLSAAQEGVTLNLSTNTGLVAQPVFSGSTLTLNGSFEILLGSKYNDNFVTNTPGTVIDGGEGNDRITSTAIDTQIIGGFGEDTIVLTGAGGLIDGGDGADSISGTIAPGSMTHIATGAGNDTVNISGVSNTLLSSVSISLGDGSNSLTASHITGKVYATNGGSSQSIDAFGSASTAVSTISVSSSSDIDIFGSASMGSTVTVTGGSDVSIFGSGTLTMSGVNATGLNRNSITTTVFGSASPIPTITSVSGSSNVDIFGSASTSGPNLSATILGSTNIDIFGSASSTGLSLDATIRSSSDIDIFGSASAGMSTVTVENGSSDVSIFGSASTSGGVLQVSISSSTDIDIFGSASSGVTIVTVSGSTDIDIFGSASPNAGNLSATINSSTNVDIFGSASGGTTTVTTLGTSEVDIFGSALPGTTRVDVVNSSGNVSIFGSASPMGSNLTASVSSSSNVDIFGSASSGVTTVTVSGSTDIDIFGSASPDAGNLTATVSSSTNVDIFGSAAGGTTTVTVLGTSEVDIFGSASPGTTRVAVVNSSGDVSIFGSASPTGSGLTASVSNSSNVDIFGSASLGVTTVTVSGSTDIDIFGSASPDAGNLTATVSSSTDIDIFGSASGGTTIVTTLGSSEVDIFGSASSGTTRVEIVNSSGDVSIFGSASPTGSNLTASISNSSKVDIFGSASSGVTTVTVLGSTDIDIFGSASPDAGNLTATVSSSTDVDIFGSASGGTTTVTTLGTSEVDIFGSALPGTTRVEVVNSSGEVSIFGSASPTGSTLNATVSSSSEVSIFGSASPGTTTVNVTNGSSEVSIFGSASSTGSKLDVTVSSSSDIGIFGSAVGDDRVLVTGGGDIGIYGIARGQVSLSGVRRAIIEAVAFGTAATGPVVVDVTSSLDVDIFGSATSGPILNATVTSSSNVDIFGSASPGTITVITSQDVDIFGSASTGTMVAVTGSSDIDVYSGRGDQITLQSVKRTRIDGGVFGSASGPGISVDVGGGSSEVGIFGTSSKDSVRVGQGSYIGMDLRSGDDTVEIDGAEHVVVLTDDGIDRVTVRAGSDMLIYLGAGADRAEIFGGQFSRLIGEEGDDEMMIANGISIQIDGGNGNDKVIITGGNGINVRGDSESDQIDIYGGVGISAVGGIGNDTLRVFGSLGSALGAGKVYALLDGQDGNDTLEIRPLLSVSDRGLMSIPLVDAPDLLAPIWMNIPTWISAPTVTTFASSVALVGGNGTNTLWLQGAERLYGIGGDDVDNITLEQGSSSEVTGGRGADIITVRATGSDNRVFGDQGNDLIHAYAGTRLGIFGEEDVDSITFHDGQDGFARGGEGDDVAEVLGGMRMVLAGEVGNDNLTIRGGTSGVAAGGTGNDTLEITGGSLGLLLGQTGNDLLKATGGTLSIVSGGDGDDIIEASNRGDDLYGDDGDDEYRILTTTSVTSQLLRLRELLYVDPNNFEPEARGSDTIDLSAFTSSAVLDLSVLGLFNNATVGMQSVIPAQLQLILLGSLENIIGTSGNDALIGNSESNRLEGRGGNDSLMGQAGDDTLDGGTGDDTLDGGSGDDLYLFTTQTGIPLGTDTIFEVDHGGIDGLDFSGMPVGLRSFDLNLATTQNLNGGLLSLTLRQSSSNQASAEVEEVVGTDYNDTIIGNALDNRIEPRGGDDIVDGRSGSDIYVFAGRGLGSDQIIDAATGAGRDTLDFVGFDGPIHLDVAMTTAQNLGGMSLTLAAADSIENVLGTSFDDRIFGNALDNAIFGGAGADYLDGRAGNDRIVGDLPAIVLLDFDSAYQADRGDYLYTVSERNAIEQRLANTYSAFKWTFTQYESVVPVNAPLGSRSAKDLTADMSRSFVRIAFNQGRGGGISGDAGEVDFRNIRRRLTTEVNINAMLPSVRQILQEQVSANYTPLEFSDMVVAFTSTIAGHELAHTAGLRHGDSFGPIGSGFYPYTDRADVYPVDSRPASAIETGWHTLASPASVGTPLSYAARATFFGEREAIKMAFNEIGRSRIESGSAPGSHSGIIATNGSLTIGTVQAEDLGSLANIYVPNLAPTTGYARSGQSFNVAAMAVVGDLKTLANSSSTELDIYKFNGVAGDLVNVELLASSIRPLRGDAFDGELRIYGPDGTLLAFNDDDFEGTTDATLLDILLTQTGTYYVSVGLSAQPFINATGGRYELFLTRFKVGTSGPVLGDTIVGGPGIDTLTGTAADDTFVASSVDVIQGQTATDVFQSQGEAPIAVNDNVAAVEAGGANNAIPGVNPNGNVLTNDTDLDVGDTKTVIGVAAGNVNPVAVNVSVPVAGNYGSLIVAANGDFTYTLDNNNPSVQALRSPADTLIDIFTYTMQDSFGLSSSAQMLITIAGANDTASINGTATGSLTEDASMVTTSGTLTVTDPDTGEATFQTTTAASLVGTYGNFTFVATTGVWNYTLDNSRQATNALKAGQSVSDTLIVKSLDSSASRTIAIAITGANDVASINGTATGSLTEDAAIATASGTLTVTDPDTGEATFQTTTAASLVGIYGYFTFVATTGAWNYTLDNSRPATDALKAGQSGSDTLIVKSFDGSASRTIAITIAGANDVASINGTATGSLTEDAAIATVSGRLMVTDPDTGEAIFQTTTAASLVGTYGYFTFAATTGVWNYTLDNDRPATDALTVGQIVSDSLMVKSLDDTVSKAIVITITGAGIGAVRSVQVLNSTACGSLTVASNATITVTGPVQVNATCASGAIIATGNARITASQVQVVGGVQLSGNANISPAPISGSPSFVDPLATLAAPLGNPATTAISCSGNTSLSVTPGSYTSITASGSCNLIFQPGVYIIDGGGMNVSGSASVSGTGVMFYNAGSNFPNLGGSFGRITFSGNGTFNLKPQTTGIYSGITFFQARDNTQTLSMSGRAIDIKGAVYAPKAQLQMSGSGQLQMTLIVDRLKLSGNAVSSLIVGAMDPNGDLTMSPSLGQLNANVLRIAIESRDALASRDQLDRIRDAIQTINTDFGAYGVRLVEVDPDLDSADVRLKLSDTSPCGSLEQGILGCSTKWGEITLVQGWAWYAGADANAITAGQFDLQTIVTHELGHSIGLEHSSDTKSVMQARLETGVSRRGFTDHDLALLKEEKERNDDNDSFHALRAWNVDPVLQVIAPPIPSFLPTISLNPLAQRSLVDVILDERVKGLSIPQPGKELSNYHTGQNATPELIRGKAQLVPMDRSVSKPASTRGSQELVGVDSFFESVGDGMLDVFGIESKRSRKTR